MAQILNSIKNANKEYSETKYKYETEIKEFQEKIKEENNKKLDGWFIEKKDYIETFNKKYFWLIELVLILNILIFIGLSIYSYLNILHHLFVWKIIGYLLICILISFLEYSLYYFIRHICSNNYINRLNLESDNKITQYNQEIEKLKKHYKSTFTSKNFIKKSKFLENHGKKDFVSFIKDNFDNKTYMINDFSHTIRRNVLQIDHILVTPKGIFCIEIKSGNKVYYPSTNNKWKYYSVDTECEIENPQEAITEKSELLEELLGNLCLQIIPTVVLTDPDSGFIGETTNNCKVLNMDEFPIFYKEKKVMFSDEQVLSISRMIFDLNLKKS